MYGDTLVWAAFRASKIYFLFLSCGDDCAGKNLRKRRKRVLLSLLSQDLPVIFISPVTVDHATKQHNNNFFFLKV